MPRTSHGLFLEAAIGEDIDRTKKRRRRRKSDRTISACSSPHAESPAALPNTLRLPKPANEEKKTDQGAKIECRKERHVWPSRRRSSVSKINEIDLGWIRTSSRQQDKLSDDGSRQLPTKYQYAIPTQPSCGQRLNHFFELPQEITNHQPPFRTHSLSLTEGTPCPIHIPAFPQHMQRGRDSTNLTPWGSPYSKEHVSLFPSEANTRPSKAIIPRSLALHRSPSPNVISIIH